MTRFRGDGRAAMALALVTVLSSCSRQEPPGGLAGGEEPPGGPLLFFEESCCEDDLACQDGNWCNGIEICDCWGECGPGDPPCVHDLGDDCLSYASPACVVDRIDPPGEGYGRGHCDVIQTCTHCEDTGDCSDGNRCTVDTCGTDTLCHYAPLDCDDSDVCTDDTCDPGTGCHHTWIPGCCNVQADCDDLLYCTGAEVCDTVAHVCIPGTNPCEALGLTCITAGTCNETTDSCDVLAGYCYIDGACWTDGTRQPGAGLECNACLSATDQFAWVPAPAGWACPTDTIACTADRCDGLGACVHPVNTGWCLIDSACVANGTNRPGYECVACLSATDQFAWSNRPFGTACTSDGHSCTTDRCDGLGACTHPVTSVVGNDACNGWSMSQSGSGLTRYWTGSGDTFCALDQYSSACGGAGGTDTVHYFDIPAEYETYRYRVMVGGPAAFNSIVDLYGGAAVSPRCGVAGAYLGCNDDGVGTCWSAVGGALGNDSNDSCWYNSSAQDGVTFPNGRTYIVVDTVGTGGTYSIRTDRVSAPDTSVCSLPLPEIQMAGTWTGRTSDATATWASTMPYCYGSTGSSCLRLNLYHIDHMDAPWNATSRGYIVRTDGTSTTGGFDNVLFFAAGRCDSGWSELSCDNDTYHWSQGGLGLGSKIVTGPVPAGRLGTIAVANYNCGESGYYTLTVDVDDDGDGVANGSDGSGLLYGATPVVGGGNGGKQVPFWPWGDHGQSSIYPSNLCGSCGQEVYYYHDNALAGRDMNVFAFPRVRGDVWAGQPANLWDMALWVNVAADGLVYCNGTGWFTATAGTWYSCDAWGAGEYEQVYVQDAAVGRHWFAIDSKTCTPPGGWYSVEFR